MIRELWTRVSHQTTKYINLPVGKVKLMHPKINFPTYLTKKESQEKKRENFGSVAVGFRFPSKT